MRKLLALVTLFSVASITAWAQAASSSQAAPAKPAAKPAIRTASGEPTAVFDTTAGKLRCKLFRKRNSNYGQEFYRPRHRRQGLDQSRQPCHQAQRPALRWHDFSSRRLPAS